MQILYGSAGFPFHPENMHGAAEGHRAVPEEDLPYVKQHSYFKDTNNEIINSWDYIPEMSVLHYMLNLRVRACKYYTVSIYKSHN